MFTKREATAHHEAGHAVVSFALGVKFSFIVLWDDENGMVVPECGNCASCERFFQKNDPREQPPSANRDARRLADHARGIRDDLRRRAAIAVAGEIAETIFTGDSASINPKEVECDRRHAREASRFLHIWSGTCPGLQQWDASCTICDPFLKEMRNRVEVILGDTTNWNAVTALAVHLKDSPLQPTDWFDTVDIVQKSGARFESVDVSSLPSLP